MEKQRQLAAATLPVAAQLLTPEQYIEQQAQLRMKTLTSAKLPIHHQPVIQQPSVEQQIQLRVLEQQRQLAAATLPIAAHRLLQSSILNNRHDYEWRHSHQLNYLCNINRLFNYNLVNNRYS